ncbi:1-(5-phosphoribosyl)-5-[(5-phosphoribosylamino)methylideneamino]imidazole-4-carboxamide isomerase [Helicobacter marmotae]|uniref:1-(5-phosphoribosyl)-5-[(5-phosphoribosylamino)methylideneamino] imidazole-4-carboxamide isomerase n=1 Tax=Helicobacter marmotae TaxID=152490 RepID=A0A3D8I3J8_9HELI|nr:1-(5-phosphoribosyl)-5-[(5-phosphoribosylamino)methylideneamino]imidazole-4-carboxamide isomerase [Helicobacter marmotae]RDU59740.1 1-(5-phosphoribosyl)-5-[(5-phosphoribosylamino)methylideneamino]imidazole-4-carboxamide isomerase [Helicobacter marmotae]
MALDIYPAIDLKNGKAVRLLKGDMGRATFYGEALDFAKKFADMGAKYLHIVDLDGAIAGSPQNQEVIEKIVKTTSLKIQLGGGIRNEETIKSYLEMGIARVILGSIAIHNWAFVKQMAEIYPIVVGIDAREGRVAAQGWVEESGVDSNELARKFAGSQVQAIICTDINRDGALSGVNMPFAQEIALHSGIDTIASGGFASMRELEMLDCNPHISGVIVGKAFYEGRINLQEAFQLFCNK